MGDRRIGRLAALVLLVLSACVLGGCEEGTRQAPAAAGPPIAARSFNSKMPFFVWVVREEGAWPEDIGKTPAAKPIEIPACWMWGVTTKVGSDMRAVAHEMAAQNIPGLRIHSARDDDLVHLEDLKGLQWLSLWNTEVTDAGLAHLKELKGLQLLDLGITKVTDAGLAHLKELKGLQSLDLGWTKVTDAGLVHLMELKELQRLYLAGTQVTETGLARLAKLKRLQTLSLHGTEITDAGLVHLKELKGLQSLYLRDTKVTDAGVKEFQQSMPNVHVQY